MRTTKHNERGTRTHSNVQQHAVTHDNAHREPAVCFEHPIANCRHHVMVTPRTTRRLSVQASHQVFAIIRSDTEPLRHRMLSLSAFLQRGGFGDAALPHLSRQRVIMPEIVDERFPSARVHMRSPGKHNPRIGMNMQDLCLGDDE